MNNVLNDLGPLKEYIQNRKLCLFLDYDGTLSPIASRPKEATLSPEMRSLLEDLAAAPDCKVYIVSGRSLKDIKETVGIGNIGYIGNHGFEMDVPHVVFGNFNFEQTRKVLVSLKTEIEKAVSSFKGSFVEDKGVTLSVHYRLLEFGLQASIQGLLDEIVKPFVARGEVSVSPGKKVFEIKPPVEWDKGRAVLWLLDKLQKAEGKMPAVVYIGDDRTDEDAFRALKGKGVIIKVGEGETAAEYVLKEQGEVAVLLKVILGLRKTGAGYGA